jgi:hypothetical protein
MGDPASTFCAAWRGLDITAILSSADNAAADDPLALQFLGGGGISIGESGAYKIVSSA